MEKKNGKRHMRLNSNCVSKPGVQEFCKGTSDNIRSCGEKEEKEGPDHNTHIGSVQGTE